MIKFTKEEINCRPSGIPKDHCLDGVRPLNKYIIENEERFLAQKINVENRACLIETALKEL